MIEDFQNINIDVNQYIVSGQLVISNGKNIYWETTDFDAKKTVAYWKQKIADIKKEGFRGVRILAEMMFALYEEDGMNKLMEYELKYNELGVGDNELYLCAFDKSQFPAYVLEDMVKKHNVLINVKELIKPNPYYINYKKQLEEYTDKITMRKYLSLGLKNKHKPISTSHSNENRGEAILKHVLKSTGDGIWEWNVESNQIYLNKSFLHTLGYQNDQRTTKAEDLIKLIHPEDRYGFKEQVKKCCDNKIEYIDYEIRVKSKKGEWIWFRIRGTVIKKDAAHGSSLKMVGMFINITERKIIRNELNEKMHFEKLRTDFFSNISHELRTPLNVILGSLQLQGLYIASENTSKYKKEYSKANKRMKQNSYRLLRLVNNIIDITKIDSGFYDINLENYDINMLIREIVLSVEDYIENAGLQIEFKANTNQAIIACDPEKIERIMLNLLSNAIKFTEAGGKIVVTVKMVQNRIFMSVRDTGIGIPQEKINSVFERFKQVGSYSHRKNEGSGIGLSLVRLLIEAHKGKVTVRSKLNEGTEFIIELPNEIITEEIYVKEEVVTRRKMNIERLNIEFSDIYG
ncbi:ATP-binding protein [Alkaliphilus metalliredigens]|uniref:ATP-binding protein n=1 Tax=Alkaliphilus metalliredigens TaxID=208226 RepID=UPI00005CC71A|nr:ATP-binding protein [Alkaliphilus metalliredigens]